MNKHSALLHCFVVACSLAAFGCKGDDDDDTTPTAWQITSPAFKDGDPIPEANTCNGHPFGYGTSPELDFTDGPSGTQSYALVFIDTAIEQTATDPTILSHAYHWAIWDIPSTIHKLPAGLGDDEFPSEVPGARQWGTINSYGYLGPCPNFDPSTADADLVNDHYSFTLYAVDKAILDYPAVDPDEGNYVHTLNQYLVQHNLGKVELHGTSNAHASMPPAPNTPPPPSARP